MIVAGSALKDYAIEAKDGRLGTVKDVLFDDKTWQVRWFVVDAGTWLTGRMVLVHPSAVASVDYVREALSVTLTMAQVKDSPSVAQDRPVSRQMEASLYDYYGWDPVWGGSIFGGGTMTQAFGSPYGAGLALHEPVMANRDHAAGDHANGDHANGDGDPQLRSIDSVTGYHIHADDGAIGHLQDFLIDDQSWGVRYLIVDTRNWWPGQHVLIAPFAVTEISWTLRRIDLNVSCDQVRSSPAWDPAEVVDESYEARLHSHYSWPGYGW